MNYSRRSVIKIRKHLKSKGIAVRNKVTAILLIVLVIGLIAGTSYAGHRIYDYVMSVLKKTPDISAIDATPSGYISTVLDAEGNTTAQLIGTGSNRVYVTLDEIPTDLQHAFVAIEDSRFYEHNGIDLKGIVRAGIVGVTTGSFREGASTITQQLLKNNVFEGWTTETRQERIERKIQEQYLAVELEKEVSKDWIMENYLNTINLGQNTLGVQAASMRYFGKDVSELNLSECAVIAAITQNPSKYNPISHPEDNGERRRKVLEDMCKEGFITKEQCEEALNDDVYTRISDANIAYESRPANITSYFVDAMTEQVIKDLQSELGYSEAQAYKALYSGGLTISSTQDPHIQEICDEVVNDESNYDIDRQVSFSYALTIQGEDGSLNNYNEQTMKPYLESELGKDSLNFYSEENAQEAINGYREYLLQDGGTVIGENVTFTPQPQAALTVIDQATGQVKALVGGRGDKVASKTLNRAYGTTRQPGSTFKILTTYAPALEENIVTLATEVLDEEVEYANGKVVRNADGKYHGWVSIRYAIQQSYNTVAIKTSREVTLEKCFQSAKDFGITTLADDDAVEALPLGGVKGGVTNMELTAAYAAIADGGVYHEPVLYTRILDHDGNVLLEKEPEEHRVIKDSTAYMLISAMEDVVKYGTGRRAAFDGMSLAGKTGTTTAARDAWFTGFSPYYTCAVWGGYDDNSELESTDYAKTLWKNVMSRLHEGLDDPGFNKPDSIAECSICSTTGLRAGSSCYNVYTDYFTEDTLPEDYCPGHVTVELCTESGMLAGPFCPEDKVTSKTYVKGSSKIPGEKCNIHTTPSVIEGILNGLEGEDGTNGTDNTGTAPSAEGNSSSTPGTQTPAPGH